MFLWFIRPFVLVYRKSLLKTFEALSGINPVTSALGDVIRKQADKYE